ncbi:4186_t:CDS:2, partial [Paraglomus occultum]
QFNPIRCEASSVLSATFSEYNLGSMSMGIGCILITVVCLTGVAMNSSRAIFNNRDIGNWKTIQIFSWIGIVLLAIVMFASSYVEEEHQFWYFWTQTMWVIWLHDSLKNNIDKKSFIFCIGQMLLVRLIRTWNQTGQKYAGLIDLKYYLNSSYAPAMWFMVFIVIIGLFLITLKEIWNLANVRSHKILIMLQCLASLLVLLTTVLIVEYKLDMDGGRAVMPAFCLPFSRFAGLYLKPFAVARLAYAALLCLVGVAIVTDIIYNKALTSAQKGQTTLPTILLCSVTYLVILLARPHNVILFALFAMQMKLWILWQQKILSSESPSPKFANHFTLIVLEHMSFFALGNSNSLASIDISHAYTGVNRYDEVTVGLLTFIANWAGPIWWAFAGIVIHNQVFNVDKIASKEKDSIRNNLFGRTLLEYLFDSTLFYSIVLLSLSIAVTILKTHLFIWTVFSPKYLYQMIWNVLFHFFVEVCGGVLVNMLLMK